MINSQIWVWTTLTVIYFICVIKIDGASFRHYMSASNYTTYALNSSNELYNSPSFNKTAKTIIFTHGFNGSPERGISDYITKGYSDNYYGNFIFLDWQEEASSAPFGIAGYAIKAVPNSKKVGYQVGEAILRWTEAGFNMDQLHLMGHSLGAHLMGYAGNRVTQNGTMVPRITGLDPAGPLFSKQIIHVKGLRKSSAVFVDVVHSSPGRYGISESIGHVDIWLNRGDEVQPGCSNSTRNPPFGLADGCSHARAPLAYAESLGSPTSFPAVEAKNYKDWLNNKDTNRRIVFISENIDTKARGNFYLRTNSKSPFGLGEEGLHA